MRAFIILIFSCASTFGADTNDIRVVTTTRTNISGAVSTKDVITRGGQTNLVRNTVTKSGVVQIRAHRFYHDGSLVGMLTATLDSSSTTSEAGSPYAVGFEYGRSNQLKYAAIVGKDGILVDMFTCTNGILFPVETSQLREAAGISSDAKELISGARNGTPKEFNQKVQQLIEKHKDK